MTDDELQGDNTFGEPDALYRCDVCGRRTWITHAGLVARHYDMGGKHYCPLSGQGLAAVTVRLARAVYRHPSNYTPPA